MNKRKLIIFYLLQWTWGIIQNILGFFMRTFLLITDPRRLRGDFFGSKVIVWNRNDSVSLGMFIFLSKYDLRRHLRVLVHEYGHSIQSCILGPLYLPLIGIPSYIWCNSKYLSRTRSRKHIHYSSFYPEIWANHLGKIATKMPSIDY